MNTSRVKGFICGLLIGGIALSGVNIYANNKKEEESNKNIKKAIECLEKSGSISVDNSNKNANKSTAYSNIAIAEELHEMNNKLDKLIK